MRLFDLMEKGESNVLIDDRVWHLSLSVLTGSRFRIHHQSVIIARAAVYYLLALGYILLWVSISVEWIY